MKAQPVRERNQAGGSRPQAQSYCATLYKVKDASNSTNSPVPPPADRLNGQCAGGTAVIPIGAGSDGAPHEGANIGNTLDGKH